MQNHVCVTVLVTSVGQVVKVSALREYMHAATKVKRYTFLFFSLTQSHYEIC